MSTRGSEHLILNVLLGALLSLGLLSLYSCSESEFKQIPAIETLEKRPSAVVPPSPTPKSTPVPGTPPGPLALSFAPAYKTQKLSLQAGKVDLMVVVDVSTSMPQVLNNLTSNINDFITLATQNKFQLRLGGISFVDRVINTLPLTQDAQSFQTFVRRLNVVDDGNIDLPEASLTSIEAAIAELAKVSNEEQMRAVYLITDNTGHVGGPNGNRDCAVERTANLINSSPASVQKGLRLFYSVPANNDGGSNVGCRKEFKNPVEQMESLLNISLPTLAREKRGGSLGWPVNSNTMQAQFFDFLKSVQVQENFVCLGENISLIDANGQELLTQRLELGEVYLHQKNGTSYPLSISKSRDEVLAAVQSKAKAQLETCCLLEEKAAQGDFSSCSMKETKEIELQQPE